jgi:hypothetical protein
VSGRRAPANRRALAVLETELAIRAYVPRTRPVDTAEVPVDPELILVLDFETRTDTPAQPLLAGSYRVYEAGGKLRQEGLVYGDDITAAEREILERYVAEHPADNGGHLRLWSRAEFARRVLWPIAYEARALVCGFNLPFDLSRLAVGWHRNRRGGFSLRIWESLDNEGRAWAHKWRPELSIKALDSKRNFSGFTTPRHLDPENRLLGGGAFRGRFLDLRTFAYALTDRSFSLRAAAVAFGLEVTKDEVEEHGVLTPEYIDYNRQDVRVTWALYRELMTEWRRHPIPLAPEQAYSPAAVSKSYLRLAGVTPPIERSDVSAERLGYAMTAYYGGRTECRIRHVPLPIRYADFSSMYVTVFALARLWDWVTAERLTAVDATDEARRLLADVDRARLHDPAIWPALAGMFCRIRPTGELLPVRGRYGADVDLPGADVSPGSGSPAGTIGLNELEGANDLWFALADLVDARLLGHTTPTILDAFRVIPIGQLAALSPLRLRGSIAVDPARDDLFRLAIEERARIRRDGRRSVADRERLAQFLKTFSLGGAYGVFAEYRQLDPVPGGREVTAHGLWPITARVTTPEEPGAFCYPPLAGTITALARLLLGLLQADIEAAGGTYLACDTDSLLVVASEEGGLVPSPGGPERMPDGTAAVRALSWATVEAVLDAINALNPYVAGTVTSLVKLEDENFAPGDRSTPGELYGLASSSKRYVAYNRIRDGVVVRKPSEHGLGLYRPPVPPRPDWNANWREWVEIVWRRIIDEAEGRDPGPEPEWFDLPAVSQLPVSSPGVLEPFRALNDGRPYAQQIKPFGFLLLGHVDPLAALPAGLERGDVVPVAPFTNRPEELLGQPWHNRRDGRPIAVTTRPGGERGKVRLTTYRDVVAAYRRHPETKSGDPARGLGHGASVGLLPRLLVRATGLPLHIGKESNRLDEVEDGVIADPDDVYVEYRDERREWEIVVPMLRRLRDEHGWQFLAHTSGLSERELRYVLNGRKVPHRVARGALLRVAVSRGHLPGDPAAPR